MNVRSLTRIAVAFGISVGGAAAQQCPPVTAPLSAVDVARNIWAPPAPPLPQVAATNSVYNPTYTIGKSNTVVYQGGTPFVQPKLIASKGDGTVTIYDAGVTTNNLITLSQPLSSTSGVVLTHFASTATQTIPSGVLAMVYDRNGQLWLICRDGLRRASPYTLVESWLAISSPVSVAQDGSTIWIPNQGEVIAVNTSDFSAPPKRLHLPASDLSSVAYDGAGALWGVSYSLGSLIKIPIDGSPASSARLYNLPLRKDSSVYWDGANLWLTAQGGLMLLDRLITSYGSGALTVAPYENMAAMAYDAAGSLWAARSSDGTFLKLNPCTGAQYWGFVAKPATDAHATNPAPIRPVVKVTPTAMAFDGSAIWFVSPSTGLVSRVRL